MGNTLVRFFVLVALYVSATWFAESFIMGAAQVTIFWPAAGVAFGAVLRYGWRWSLFIVPGVLIAHVAIVPVPSAFMPYSVAGNLLGALAGAYIASAGGMRPDMSMVSGLALLRGAVVMALVAASIGVIGLIDAGMVAADDAARALVMWALGDLVGILCITPTMLLLTAPATEYPDDPPASEFAEPLEVALWGTGLVLSYLVIYLVGQRDSFYALGMVALPLMALAWSAFRCQPIWTAAGTGLSVLFVTSLTGLGLAGFEPPVDIIDSVLLLGLMTLFGTMPLMLVALVHTQRRMARRGLRHAIRDAATQRDALEKLVAERTRELNDANAQLETLSHTDSLTGLRNRRYLAKQITADLAFYDREQTRKGHAEAVVFALIDIDHFKQINDNHGHAVGDRVLQQVSDVLMQLARTGDYVVRWGGEEFLLVFRPTAGEHVPVLGERLRAAVEDHEYEIGDGNNLPVTCSIGLAEYPLLPDAGPKLDWEQMIELADAALYWVKKNGRNGWAALRPTARTNLDQLMNRLPEGAEILIHDGQLSLVSSKKVEKQAGQVVYDGQARAEAVGGKCAAN